MSLAKLKTQKTELLLEVGRLLSSKLKLSELLHIIIPLAARVVNADRASLFLVDEGAQELYFDVAMGLPPEVAKIRLKMGQGIAGAVAQQRKPIVINNARSDPRWYSKADKKSGYVTRSIIAVPLLLRGKCIGVAQGLNKLEGEFTLTDLRFFEAFASQAAIAIDNARLFASVAEERRKLDTLLNEMQDAAILTDGRGGIVFANAAATRFFGRSDAPGTVQEGLSGMTLTPPYEAVLASTEPLVRFEAVREQPKKLVLAGTASLIESALQGRVIVFRDVTEEKQEEGLKRSFLSLISHKLKTPLSSVTGYSQLLLSDLKKKPGTEFAVRGLQTIYTQGSKLAVLVEKLLNYTVLEELDAADCALKSFAVDEALQDAIKGTETWLEDYQGASELRSASGLTAYGDPLLIRDAVKNLIENGIKFSEKGSGKVLLWAAPGDNGTVEIRVQDNGPGIPPEETENIFKKFYQVESSFTGQIEGWGLGLPFVSKVLQKLNGSVRLESRIGEGTTIILTLPSTAP
ncbi:MAG: ATP-binding protein [Elusimicrobiota bacterium]